MGVRDFAPVFCDACGASIAVMMDQNGEPVLACACAGSDGLYDLDDDAVEWVTNSGHRMETNV